MSSWKLIALDLDGTLVNLSGAGSRAMDRAFCQFLELDETPRRSSFAGRTDRAIVREVLTAQGKLSPSAREEEIQRTLSSFFGLFLRLFPGEIAQRPYLPTPGANQFLEHLAEIPRVKIGLATGNIENSALYKLHSAGLPDIYDFAAFGRDVELRAELLRLAFERGASTLPDDAESWEGIVIGDTPHDIEAARALGATAIAVAQGPFSLYELERCQPDLAVFNLTELMESGFFTVEP